MLSPSPTDQSMQFFRCVFWDLVGVELAASGDHLVGGKPDAKVPELDQPDTVRPPYQAELSDSKKQKPPLRLSCLIWSVLHSGSMASLVWKQTERGCPHTP
jgi:hypothetical protein